MVAQTGTELSVKTLLFSDPGTNSYLRALFYMCMSCETDENVNMLLFIRLWFCRTTEAINR